MTKTLLAVEDSATMRKVIEITFGGDDYQVVTADSRDKAVGQLGSKPAVVLIDAALGAGDEGYALAKEVRQKDGNAVVILLSSRHNPYDAAKGKDAGADDFMDQPFDTQQILDKVKKAVSARAGGAGPQAGAGAPAAAAPAPAPVHAPPAAAAAAAPIAKPTPAAGQKSRSATLMFGGDVGVPPPRNAPAGSAVASPSPAAPPVAAAAARPMHKPSADVVATTPSAAAHHGGAVAGAVNGHLAAKLGELGLSKDQAEAVLALSRDVLERVVWEVVPQLAETLIKEEIARLTKE
ncbi:MAG: response regulator transcription factor [Polyangiaceae bacterium]